MESSSKRHLWNPCIGCWSNPSYLWNVLKLSSLKAIYIFMQVKHLINSQFFEFWVLSNHGTQMEPKLRNDQNWSAGEDYGYTKQNERISPKPNLTWKKNWRGKRKQEMAIFFIFSVLSERSSKTLVTNQFLNAHLPLLYQNRNKFMISILN